jgi:manganese transport protein
MWLAGEVAIIACDAAEVIGAAAALHMLFGLTLWVGALLSALLLLPFAWLRQRGRLWLNAGVAVVLAAVVVLIGIQLAVAAPDGAALLAGMAPDLSAPPDVGLLWLAAGIVGATVMPHNLYLHSSLVTPVACQPESHRRRLLRTIQWDSASSLFLAMLINVALLVLAGAVFHVSAGTSPGDGDELSRAARLIDQRLPGHWGGTLFALALLGCSLNGMVTTTLAGQVVMQGFLHIRLSLARRALLTRGLALVPALLAVAGYGGHSATPVLVASQVVLGLQLPFAVIPLLWFAGDRRLMGEHRPGVAFRRASWCVAGTIVLLNGLLLWQTVA